MTRPLAALALCLAAPLAWAQASGQRAPDAGQLLEETRRTTPNLPASQVPRLLEPPQRPSLAMASGVTVLVTEFRITGAVSFTADALADVVKPWLGRRLDVKGLGEAAAALTRHYQSRGHLLSYAYLPAQKVADGSIELAVLEGRVENIQVVTAQDTRLRDATIQAVMNPVTRARPVLQSEIERRLLTLNDIPGVTARAAFTPGATTGGAEMVVSVAEDEPLDFRADFSNHGSKSTGEYRMGVTAQFRDLFGWGDYTTARGLVSDKGGLVSGTLSSTVPVGSEGWKFGASVSRLRYQLAGAFSASGASGIATTWGVDANYPLVRTAEDSLLLRAGLDYKRLRDEIPGALNLLKRNTVGELGFSFETRDRWGGLNAGSASASLGQLLAGAEPRREWRKGNLQLLRQQAVWGPVSIYARLSTQAAGGTLDSSEKLGLGGAGAVRAYASGELSVDQGQFGQFELRYATDYLGGNVTASVLHDTGRGQINRALAGQPGNQQQLHGSGFGLLWQGGGYGASATLAWRGSRLPTTGDGDSRPRFFFQFFLVP
jgi:hemolysin activation/secretion protein